MKKTLLSVFALAITAMSASAGGLVTNTNQNAAFLRQLSQESIIDITGLYANPAGTAFLDRGFHISLDVQNAVQSRDITTTFPLFAYNEANRSAEHKFEGTAKAPVIPSFQLSYNWEKWSVNASFGITGGGGKCEFDNGLGTFEALYSSQIYSQVPSAVGAVVQQVAGFDPQYALTGYDLNAYMKGRQYYFGFHVGTTYKFTDSLSGFLGLRAVYATNNYNGWVQDVSATVKATSPYAAMLPADYQTYTYKLDDNELALNCDQTGWGFTPIVGLDWRINKHWNVAAKYEAPTKLEVKNKTEMNDYTAAVSQSNATLGQFADGRKVRSDIPAILTLGAQYSPIDAVRLQAGYHVYFDKQAKQYGDKQDLIDHATWEVTAGAEYDCCKWVTVSAGWQVTRYGLSDAYMNDLSFVTNSNSVGGGVRINAAKHVNFDLSYMQTIYQSRDVTMQTAAGPKTDHYWRSNRVLGLGVNLDF